MPNPLSHHYGYGFQITHLQIASLTSSWDKTNTDSGLIEHVISPPKRSKSTRSSSLENSGCYTKFNGQKYPNLYAVMVAVLNPSYPQTSPVSTTLELLKALVPNASILPVTPHQTDFIFSLPGLHFSSFPHQQTSPNPTQVFPLLSPTNLASLQALQTQVQSLFSTSNSPVKVPPVSAFSLAYIPVS